MSLKRNMRTRFSNWLSLVTKNREVMVPATGGERPVAETKPDSTAGREV